MPVAAGRGLSAHVGLMGRARLTGPRAHQRASFRSHTFLHHLVTLSTPVPPGYTLSCQPVTLITSDPTRSHLTPPGHTLRYLSPPDTTLVTPYHISCNLGTPHHTWSYLVTHGHTWSHLMLQVQPGDFLYSIANQYSCTVGDLLSLNTQLLGDGNVQKYTSLSVRAPWPAPYTLHFTPYSLSVRPASHHSLTHPFPPGSSAGPPPLPPPPQVLSCPPKARSTAITPVGGGRRSDCPGTLCPPDQGAGWYDAQGMGAANDYCRTVTVGKFSWCVLS